MSATMLTGRVGWEEEGKDTSVMGGRLGRAEPAGCFQRSRGDRELW
jgi:hypothetical protein